MIQEIRRRGKYELEQTVAQLQQQVAKKQKEKYEYGDTVYIVRNGGPYLKVGSTQNMNSRRSSYLSHGAETEVLYTIRCNKCTVLECTRSAMCNFCVAKVAKVMLQVLQKQGCSLPQTCPKIVPRISRSLITSRPNKTIVVLPKPCPKRHRAPPPVKNALNEVIQITSKYVFLFVFLTSSLNYMHYRQLQMMNEEEDK